MSLQNSLTGSTRSVSLLRKVDISPVFGQTWLLNNQSIVTLKLLVVCTGLNTNVYAMERWFLTAHLKANVATATKAMIGIGVDHPVIPHKESTASRIGKDEICIKKIIDVVEKTMVNL